MKKMFYSLLVATALALPACNNNDGEGDENKADTAAIPGYDAPNYNDAGGGVPVSPDTAQDMNNTEGTPGNAANTGDNAGSNTVTRINRTGSNAGRTANGSSTNAANAKSGFAASGQYDSRKLGGRPKPVNTDDRYYKENPPAHSYGDTTPHRDGVNSVR
jgi:hypothetical protein